MNFNSIKQKCLSPKENLFIHFENGYQILIYIALSALDQNLIQNQIPEP